MAVASHAVRYLVGKILILNLPTAQRPEVQEHRKRLCQSVGCVLARCSVEVTQFSGDVPRLLVHSNRSDVRWVLLESSPVRSPAALQVRDGRCLAIEV